MRRPSAAFEARLCALTAAQQLASINDPLTRDAFEDAVRVSDRAADAELRVRVCESFALYLEDQGGFKSARELLVKAEQIAQDNGFDEDVAGLQVCIKEVEAELVDDGMKGYLANFRRAAKEGSYSRQDKRDALFGFIADLSRSSGRLAARGIGSIDDFKERLERARRGRGED